jgi:hypothetical protein
MKRAGPGFPPGDQPAKVVRCRTQLETEKF